MPAIINVEMTTACNRWSAPAASSGSNRGNREEFGVFPLKWVCLLISNTPLVNRELIELVFILIFPFLDSINAVGTTAVVAPTLDGADLIIFTNR
jgi:hypothetical protein